MRSTARTCIPGISCLGAFALGTKATLKPNLADSLRRSWPRGAGRISEQNVQDALREVRLALLEADVHYATAKDFIARVKAKSLGADVLAGISPGQQIVKAIHDELVALLGGQQADFNLTAIPAEVMLLGLHGSGKTTTCGKLARQWNAEIWTSGLLHREGQQLDQRGIPLEIARYDADLGVVLRLATENGRIHLKVLKEHASAEPAQVRMELDPATLLLRWQ